MLEFILAIFSVILLQIGYVGQKSGIKAFNIFSTSKIAGFKARIFHIWLIGTLLTILGTILFFYALTLGNLSSIQPIQGLGPVIIAILSVFILKDSLLSREWSGIGLVTIGIILLSIFIQSSNSNEFIDEFAIIVTSIFLIVLTAVTGILLQRYGQTGRGMVEGLISGLFAGLASVFAKLGLPPLLESFSLHWGLIALIIAQILAFIILQRGFSLGNVTKVASLFTSMSILGPVLYGIYLFHEPFHIVQGFGIILIIMGAILLSKKSQFELHSLETETIN